MAKGRVPEINDVPAQFLYEKKQDGLSGLYRPSGNAFTRFRRVLSTVWDDFREEIESPLHSPIMGVFCYRAAECKGLLAESDGITILWNDRNYIGMEESAISAEEEYLTFVLIHELCHAICGVAHTPHYEAKLDDLLLQFNHLHGTDLKNDYVTFNDEHD